MRGRLLDERCELGGRDRVHQGEVPARLVGRDLEAAAAYECTTTAPEAVVTAGMDAFHTAGLVLFAAVAASAETMTPS